VICSGRCIFLHFWVAACSVSRCNSSLDTPCKTTQLPTSILNMSRNKHRAAWHRTSAIKLPFNVYPNDQLLRSLPRQLLCGCSQDATRVLSDLRIALAFSCVQFLFFFVNSWRQGLPGVLIERKESWSARKHARAPSN